MKLKTSIVLALTLFIISSCTDKWENHYDIFPQTVDQNVWEAMQNDPEISEFVQILKDYKYDSLFRSDISYTIFVPTNNALTEYKIDNTVDKSFVDYHISSHFVQSGNIEGTRYIQTLGTKFAMFEKSGSGLKLDSMVIRKESPLYKNGKYFVMDHVTKPLVSLYDYFVINNPILSQYIDTQDSIILDRELSKPIGFDPDGNTIFDSVKIDYNKFEEAFFPVSKEFRTQKATIVFPIKQDYEAALTAMALNMKIPGYVDYNQIPLEWQQDVLVPYLLNQGVFDDLLEPEKFVWKTVKDTLKLANIKGDSVKITYTPVEKAICSNGYAYNYQEFEIPEKLYSGMSKYEAEWLLDQTGINRFAWNGHAKVQSTQFFSPLEEYVNVASNDTIIRVLFPKGYKDQFSLEFNSKPLFPRKYVMVVQTHMSIGGIYKIYVNDVLMRTFDYYDYVKYKQVLPSVVPGVRYLPIGSYNKFDMIVDNLKEYGKAKIRFEYFAPGNVLNNGLVIDYVDFLPAAN